MTSFNRQRQIRLLLQIGAGAAAITAVLALATIAWPSPWNWEFREHTEKFEKFAGTSIKDLIERQDNKILTINEQIERAKSANSPKRVRALKKTRKRFERKLKDYESLQEKY